MILRPEPRPNDLAAWKERLEDLRGDPASAGREVQIAFAQDMVDILEGRTPEILATEAS